MKEKKIMGDGDVGTPQDSVRTRTRSRKRRELERKITQGGEEELLNENNKSLTDTPKILETALEKETLGIGTRAEYMEKEITVVGEIEESNLSPNLNGGSALCNDIATPSGVRDVFKESSPAVSVSSPESFFKIRDMMVKKGAALETFHASGTSITDAGGTEVDNFQDIQFQKIHADSLEEQHGVAPSGQMKPVLRRCRIKQNVKRVEPETKDLKRGQSTYSSTVNKKRRKEAHPIQPEFMNSSGGQPRVEEITQASTLIASERPCPRVPRGAEETSRTICLQKVQGLCREVYQKCIAVYAQAAGLLQDIKCLTKSQLTLQKENKKLMALLDATEQENKAALEAKDREYSNALRAKDPDFSTLLATKEREYKNALEAKIAEYTALAASKDARIHELTEEVGATKYALVVSEAITDAAKASLVKAVIESVEIRGQLSVALEKVHLDASRVTDLEVGLNGVEEKYKPLFQMYKSGMGVEPQGMAIPCLID